MTQEQTKSNSGGYSYYYDGDDYGDSLFYGDGDGYGESYGFANSSGGGCGNGFGSDYDDSYDSHIMFYVKPFTTYCCIPKDRYIRHIEIKAKVGLILEMDENPILYKKGFHASMTPEDARLYFPDGVLTKVECNGKVLFDRDQLVCTRMKIKEIYA